MKGDCRITKQDGSRTDGISCWQVIFLVTLMFWHILTMVAKVKFDINPVRVCSVTNDQGQLGRVIEWDWIRKSKQKKNRNTYWKVI